MRGQRCRENRDRYTRDQREWVDGGDAKEEGETVKVPERKRDCRKSTEVKTQERAEKEHTEEGDQRKRREIGVERVDRGERADNKRVENIQIMRYIRVKCYRI